MMTGNRSTRFAVLGGLLAGTLLLLGAAPTRAQSTDGARTLDARWLPWVGCWRPVGSVGAEGSMLCFRPVAGRSGVEMLSVQGQRVVSHRMIRADGQALAESQDGCTGAQRARFSSDGRRVFTTADLRCEGGVTRKTTGIMSMIVPTRWVDVKSVDVGGTPTAWVERYDIASQHRMDAAGLGDIGMTRALAIESARMAASAPIDVNDVIEASGIVAPAALKAWIAERHNPFDLDAASLLSMKKAGVPGDVIDVMVAVTYPKKFALAGPGGVSTRELSPAYAGGQDRYPRSGFQSCDPFFSDPYCFGYGYGYYGYGVNPYMPYGGLGYGGFYGYGYGYTPVIINVRPTTPTSGYQHGRVVKGRGYVRGAPAGSGGSGASANYGHGSSHSPSQPSSGGRATGRTAHHCCTLR